MAKRDWRGLIRAFDLKHKFVYEITKYMQTFTQKVVATCIGLAIIGGLVVALLCL